MENCQNCYDCENCKVRARPGPPQFPPSPSHHLPPVHRLTRCSTGTAAAQNCVDCHGCENLVNCRGVKNLSNKANVNSDYYAGAPPPSAPPAVGYPAPPGGSGYPPPGAATGYPPPGAPVQPIRHARPLTPLERAEATFRQFDRDHNGRLDIAEFANVLVSWRRSAQAFPAPRLSCTGLCVGPKPAAPTTSSSFAVCRRGRGSSRRPWAEELGAPRHHHPPGARTPTISNPPQTPLRALR